MLTREEFEGLWVECGGVATRGYFYKRWGGRISEEEVADLVQATALKAWKASHQFDRLERASLEDSFVAWLFAVANTVALDFFRKLHASTTMKNTVPLDTGPVFTIPDPVDEYGEVDIEDLKARALELLPPGPVRDTMALQLSGLGFLEIIEVTGLPYGTVGSRLNRGRAALRARRGEIMGVAV